ncbi:MAG: AsmA family protein [Thermodesulfobacteriota bacterium]
MSEKRFPWKWILIGFAGFLVLIVVAAYAVLATYDFNKLKPRIEQAVLDATGRQLKMQGDVELDFGFTPSLVVQEVSLENAAWGSQEPMADIQRFQVQVALWPLLQGEVEVKRLVLVKPKILLEASKQGRYNFELDTGQKPEAQEKDAANGQQAEGDAESSLPLLTVYDLQIKEASLVYRDLGTGESTSLFLEDLQLRTESPESDINLDFQGRYEEQAFSGQGSLGSIQALLQKDQVWDLDLDLVALGLELALEGEIQDVLSQAGLDVKISGQAKDLAGLQELLGSGVKLQKPLQFKARLQDTGTKAYQVSGLDCKLGQSDLQGSLDLDVSGSKPKVQADLQSGLLDVKALLPESEKGEQKKSSEGKKQGNGSGQEEAGPKKVFPQDPIDAGFLDMANASLEMGVEKLILPGLALNQLELQGSLQDGALKLSPVQAEIGQGSLDADIGLRSRQNRLEMQLGAEIQGMQLAKMLQELEAEFEMQGLLDADIQVSGTGSSVAEIMAGLDGQAGLVLGQGSVQNKYLSALGGDLRDSLFRLLNPTQEKKEQVVINCCITEIKIQEGLARIQALVLDTDLMTVKGQGEVDLGSEELDVSLDPDPKQGKLGQLTGKLGFSLSELANPFKLGGTLAEPKMVLDPGRTLISIGKGVGGGILFGPAGAAAGLLAGDSAQADACANVLEEIEKEESQAEQSPKDSDVLEKGRQEMEKGADQLKEGLNKLFN